MACLVEGVNSLALVMSISCLWIKYTRARITCQAHNRKIMQIISFTFCSPLRLCYLGGTPSPSPPPPIPYVKAINKYKCEK
jgi:hypothetical protein